MTRRPREAPAWVCDQCGGFLFGEDDVASIQDLVAGIDEHVSSLKKAA